MIGEPAKIGVFSPLEGVPGVPTAGKLQLTPPWETGGGSSLGRVGAERVADGTVSPEIEFRMAGALRGEMAGEWWVE